MTTELGQTIATAIDELARVERGSEEVGSIYCYYGFSDQFNIDDNYLKICTRNIGSSFILGHPKNGFIGSASSYMEYLGTGQIIGSQGKALRFNGTNSIVTSPDASNLKFSTDFALECWCQLAGSIGSTVVLINKENNVNDTWSYSLRVDDGSPVFMVNHILGYGSVYARGKGILDSNWHHLVGQRSAGNTQIYIDGSQFTGTTNTTAISNAGSLTLGYHERLNAYYTISGIDEIRIWNKALTTGSIQTLFSSSFYGRPETNLILGWHFDTDGAVTETDFSGNSHTGSIRNCIFISGTIWSGTTTTWNAQYWSGGWISLWSTVLEETGITAPV